MMQDTAAHLMKVQQLLLIVADVEVGVGLMSSELNGCNVIRQGCLLLIVKSSQVDLGSCCCEHQR